MNTMIKFHVEGTVFYWCPATRAVTNRGGGIISRRCFNMEQARSVAGAYAERKSKA